MFRSALVSFVLLSIVFPAAAEFQFDATGVTASITPNATAYWTCSTVSFQNSVMVRKRHDAILSDSDGDGVVRWELGSEMKPGLFTMIDAATGTISMGSTFESAPVMVPFPTKAFLQDENGRYSRFVVNDILDFRPASGLSIFWFRPGVGAWSSSSVVDGSIFDELWATNNKIMFDVRTMRPADGSPEAPDGMEAGDFFVIHDPGAMVWTADAVTTHLGEASGGGRIVLAEYSGSEAEGKMTIRLGRTEGTAGGVSFRYATADGTAKAGVHYHATSGTVTFGPGQIFASVEIPMIDDLVDAKNATFQVLLSEPSGVAFDVPAIPLSIPDNDGPPHVTVENKTIDEDGAGPREVSLKVQLSHPAPLPVTLEWLAYDRYTSTPHERGVLELPAGAREGAIVIHYMADEMWGLNQSIRVAITTAVNAMGGGEGQLDIREDDPRPTWMITGATVLEGAGKAVVTVSLSAPARNGLLFVCETENDTAVAPDDYTAKSTGAVIPAGAESTTMEISITNDGVIEASESFHVVVRGAPGQPELARTMVTIFDDDGSGERRRSMRH